MVVIHNFPPDRVRYLSSFFSILVSRGSVLFLNLSEVSGYDEPQVANWSGTSPFFQIYLHRLQRQVLRSGYTLSLEQTGQFGIA